MVKHLNQAHEFRSQIQFYFIAKLYISDIHKVIYDFDCLYSFWSLGRLNLLEISVEFLHKECYRIAA